MTTTTLASARVLQVYKGQSKVERGFRYESQAGAENAAALAGLTLRSALSVKSAAGGRNVGSIFGIAGK